MAATVIEIELWQFRGSDKEYITVQDAARYLRVTDSSVDYFASKGRLVIKFIESRKLLEWGSVQTFARELRSERQADYEVRIIRPARTQM